MSRTVDPDSFGFVVTDLARLIRAEFDRRIADAGIGLTAGEARALVHVARSGPVRQSVMAERMGVEAMTLSSYLDRLEAGELVTRTVDAADRRAKLIETTEKADAVLVRVTAIANAIRDDAAFGIDPDAWEIMRAGIKSARANLAAAREAAAKDDAA